MSRQFYAWDGNNIVLDFTDPDGPGVISPYVTARYAWGEKADQLWAIESRNANGTITDNWTLTDNLGSVRDLMNPTANTRWRDHGDYYSFGMSTMVPGAFISIFEEPLLICRSALSG